jgi:hypothetical protein
MSYGRPKANPCSAAQSGVVPGFSALSLRRLPPWAGFLLGVSDHLVANLSFRSIGWVNPMRIVAVLLALCFLRRFVKDKEKP